MRKENLVNHPLFTVQRLRLSAVQSSMIFYRKNSPRSTESRAINTGSVDKVLGKIYAEETLVEEWFIMAGFMGSLLLWEIRTLYAEHRLPSWTSVILSMQTGSGKLSTHKKL
ncbi:uncharacterized protein LOC109200857 isoform X2 [Oreochromis niloticus]|uniref:uncharacterized protein LOC109200857 isoform X2 n=1 Tax=Oreochromis niloticus TaxID=8128 RepID=UPI000904B154|nr:uncharacterized protein LOC109200857 isoform X2 [Oreochromis niloticus]